MKEEVRKESWYQCSRCLKWYKYKHECLECEKTHDFVMLELSFLAPCHDKLWEVRVGVPRPWMMGSSYEIGKVDLIPNQIGPGPVTNRSPNWLVVVTRDEIDRGRELLLAAARKWMDDALARLAIEMEPGAEPKKEADE